MTQLFVNVDSIVIPQNRQRREFKPDELNELADSIQHGPAGLQHAIVVRVVGEDYCLVSGERRLRAIKDIYELGGTFRYANQDVMPGFIPCSNIGELDELEAWEAELDENIRRSDLTWQEEAQATADLAKLRRAQAEVSGAAIPSTADLAEEIHGTRAPTQQNTVRKEVIVARHLDNAEVKKAKNLDEAFKILVRQEQKAKNEEVAQRVGKTYNSAKHTLVNGNSEDWMVQSPDGQFDVILTDPPYGMGADTFGDSGGATGGAHFYDDSYENWQDIMTWFALESFRVAAEQAHLYCFLDLDNFHEAKNLFEAVGWKVFRTPLIWYKPSAFRAPWIDQGPQRKYECILYAVKGEKKVNFLGGDVITFQPDENLGHNAQKPVALYTELLSRSATPGCKVLDPFCGSGTIFPAATGLQCYATGIEMDAGAYGIAAGRLQSVE